jgi:hypothetical protein
MSAFEGILAGRGNPTTGPVHEPSAWMSMLLTGEEYSINHVPDLCIVQRAVIVAIARLITDVAAHLPQMKNMGGRLCKYCTLWTSYLAYTGSITS